MGMKDKEKVLHTLEQIEATVGDIYEAFSMKHGFSESAREFWSSMAEAEMTHAELFRTIRLRASLDPRLDLHIHADTTLLQAILKKVRTVEQRIRTEPVSESRAYLLGAAMEETLSEFSHTRRIKTSAPDILKGISQVEEDTKHHYISLHNRALAHRGPARPSR
jgi:rubrerythrin